MKEKASRKESGEDQIPRVDPDAPGLPAGEELTIDPVSGDEIDPIKKWWDESEATSREKARNRRLEELEAGADGILDAEGRVLPRRRKAPLIPTLEVDDIPGLGGPKETVTSNPPEDEPAPENPSVAEPAAVEDEALSLDSFPVSPLKRHAREEGEEGAAFDLSELFAKVGIEEESHELDKEDSLEPEVKEAPPLEGPEMEKKITISEEEEELSMDLGDLLKPDTAKDPSALFFEFPDFEDESDESGDEATTVIKADEPVPVVAKEAASEPVEMENVESVVVDEPEELILPELDEASDSDGTEPDDEEKPAVNESSDPAPAIVPEVKVAVLPPAMPPLPVVPGEDEEIEVLAETGVPVTKDDPLLESDAEEKVIADDTTNEEKIETLKEDPADEESPGIFSAAASGEEETDEPDLPVPLAIASPEESEDKVEAPDNAVGSPAEVTDGEAGKVETVDERPVTSDAIATAAPDKAPAQVADTGAVADLPVVRKKAGCWTVFATLFFFATLLLIALFGVAGWFAWSRLGDFETEVTTRVKSSLEERGIFLDYGDWSYQFPRGLVFDEITVFDDSTKQRPFLKVAGLGINVDLIGLVKSSGELGAGEISLQNSTLSLFDGGNPVSTITGIDGEIFANEESLRIEKLTAPLGGWQVNLNGDVNLLTANPAKQAAAAPAETAAAPLSFDFSAFKALEPWLAVGGGNAGESAPVLNLTISMDAAQPDLAAIEGSLYGSEMTWHGMALASATATFNVIPETGELSVPNFQIGYGDGFIGGKLAVDTATQKLRIEQLQSTVDIFALLAQYKPEWAVNWKSIRLVDAPSIQITGEIPFEDPSQADLKVRYDHRAGMVYTLEKGELPLTDLRGNFTVNRGSIETNNAGFELFGGAVQLNGATRLTNDSRPFNGLIEITGLSLEKAAGFFGGKESGMSGRLSFVFRGVGYADLQKIRGGGTLRVEEAVIPDFPVLGRIQDYVGRAVPAFGVKGQGNITGAYIIESGVLVASDLTVANSAARIVTNGNVNLSSLETTFTAKADLVPSLAAATGLTDKAITFEGKGPLGEPTVVLKSFPIEFASVSLGSILGTSPRSLGTLQIVPGAKEAIAAFADQLGGPGVTIHPEVTTFFKSLLGEEAPAPEAAPVPAPE